MANLKPILAAICPGRPRAGVSVPIPWRLPSDHVLDPDTIRALTAACKDAWREVHGVGRIAPRYTDLRDKLARLLIAVAERGQRNPTKLQAYAVTFLRVALPHKRAARQPPVRVAARADY
jgi:hypothetical protein